jgi:hypothetical protein
MQPAAALAAAALAAAITLAALATTVLAIAAIAPVALATATNVAATQPAAAALAAAAVSEDARRLHLHRHVQALRCLQALRLPHQLDYDEQRLAAREEDGQAGKRLLDIVLVDARLVLWHSTAAQPAPACPAQEQ